MKICKPPLKSSGSPLVLNFKNHCLLCLQHEDPSILQQIATENPKGLHNFQPILEYLTGTLLGSNNSNFFHGGDNKNNSNNRYYPMTKNLPPLCKLCYDILAELHIFHCELVELQRKIKNQTEAARRIVKGTMRRNGGMRTEFFNRLKIAGLPKEDVQAMDYFIGNFHSLIVEANLKAVLPQLSPVEVTFNQNNFTTTTIPPSAIQPYPVEFVEPEPSSRLSSSPPLMSNMEEIAPISILPPYQILSSTSLLMRIPQSDDNSTIPRRKGQVFFDETTKQNGSPSSSSYGVLLVEEPQTNISYEYEGDEEEFEEGREREDDDIVILSDDDDCNEQRVEGDYQTDFNDGEMQVEEEGESDDELDVNYWKGILSSSLIMEDVDDEEEGAFQGVQGEEGPIELIEMDEDDVDGEVRDDATVLSNGVQENERLKDVPPLIPLQPIILSVSSIPRPTSSPSTNNFPTGPYKCSQCGKGYQSVQRLRYHKQEHLPGGRPKPYLCQQCQRGFSTRKLLEQHERIHTGERPFVCDVCGDRFRQGSTLYRHRKAHRRLRQSLSSRLSTPPPSSFFSENHL